MLSYEQYLKKKHQGSYVCSLSSGDQKLVYFGAKHSNNIDDGQFEELTKYWADFLVQTENSPRIVFTENHSKLDLAELSYTDAITKFGEGGAIQLLAEKSGVEFFCPEPPSSNYLQVLIEKYSRDELVYFFFIRGIVSWYRQKGDISFENYAQGYVDREKRRFGWDDYDFSLDHMKEVHSSIYDQDFDINNERLIRNAANPAIWQTVINELSREVSIARDVYIIEKIREYWLKGFNIFVVYGSGHAIIEEPDIRNIVNVA